MASRSISFYDINSVPEAKEILASGDETKINKMLFDIGFDLKYVIEQQYCLHRTLVDNKIVKGWRFVGNERKDKDWVDSGYCTHENILEIIGMRDVHFQKELLDISRRPNYSAMIISHCKGDTQDAELTYVEDKDEDESN